MLITGIFFFSNNVFYPPPFKIQISVFQGTFKLLSAVLLIWTRSSLDLYYRRKEISDKLKTKAMADNKINVTPELGFDLKRVENTVTIEKMLLISIFSFSLNPFPNKPWFLCVCKTSLLKTLWERRNCSSDSLSWIHNCHIKIFK